MDIKKTLDTEIKKQPVQKPSIEQMLADVDALLKEFAEDYRRMAE